MFFEQKFKILHDNGKIEFVDNLFEYMIKYGYSNFYYEMKFSIKPEDKPSVNWNGYSDYWYKTYKHTRSFYVYTENNIMISPDLLLAEYNSLYEHLFKIRVQKENTKRKHKCRKSHTSRRYKKLNTLPNMRNTCLVLKDEGEPEFRSKLKGEYMSIWMDDAPPSRRSTSWKVSTKRKRQYKGS